MSCIKTIQFPRKLTFLETYFMCGRTVIPISSFYNRMSVQINFQLITRVSISHFYQINIERKINDRKQYYLMPRIVVFRYIHFF